MKVTRSVVLSQYGCETGGKLQNAILHTPGEELELINEDNYRYWLFDRVPDVAKFVDEHLRFRDLLRSQGITVYELEELAPSCSHLIRKHPNSMYVNDVALLSRRGAMISRMAYDARRGEPEIIKTALLNAGIPIVHEFTSEEDVFEGGVFFGESSLFVAQTERHKRSSVNKFIEKMLPNFSEIILVDLPKTRRFMHPERVFKLIRKNLALAYMPAIHQAFQITSSGTIPIDFVSFIKSRGIEVVNVSDFEQQRHACSFLSIDESVMLHNDTALDTATRRLLVSKGVEFIFFHSDALHSGGGSLNCLTLPLLRV
jgi:arginine deiminase